MYLQYQEHQYCEYNSNIINNRKHNIKANLMQQQQQQQRDKTPLCNRPGETRSGGLFYPPWWNFDLPGTWWFFKNSLVNFIPPWCKILVSLVRRAPLQKKSRVWNSVLVSVISKLFKGSGITCGMLLYKMIAGLGSAQDQDQEIENYYGVFYLNTVGKLQSYFKRTVVTSLYIPVDNFDIQGKVGVESYSLRMRGIDDIIITDVCF